MLQEMNKEWGVLLSFYDNLALFFHQREHLGTLQD